MCSGSEKRARGDNLPGFSNTAIFRCISNGLKMEPVKKERPAKEGAGLSRDGGVAFDGGDTVQGLSLHRIPGVSKDYLMWAIL